MKRSAHRQIPVFPLVLVLLGAVPPRPAHAADGGWTSHGPAAAVETIVVHPADPDILYAGGADGVFKSTDGGQSWVRLDPANPELTGVTCLAVDGSSPSTLLLGNANGSFGSSLDEGQTWTTAAVNTFTVPPR